MAQPSASTPGPDQGRFSWPHENDLARFQAYHEANPQIYRELVRFAREALEAGRTRLSINLLFERLRWFTEIEAKGDPFKVNNTFRAWYARLLMQQEPDLAGVFETRKAEADDALAGDRKPS